MAQFNNVKTKKGKNNRSYVKNNKKQLGGSNKSKDFMKTPSVEKTDSTYKAAQEKPEIKNVKVTKRKLEITKFTKETTNFLAGIKEVMRILPESISSLFAEENLISQINMTKSVAELALQKTPNFETRENILWEFKISANKVYVKTDEYCSFGWVIKSVEKNNGKFEPTYTFFIQLYGNNFQMESLLKHYDFKEEEAVAAPSKNNKDKEKSNKGFKPRSSQYNQGKKPYDNNKKSSFENRSKINK